MERQDMLGGLAENTRVGSGTGTATATQPAPGAGQQLLITGFSISFGVSSTAAGTYVISRNGSSVQMRFGNLPIGAMAPVIYEFKRPLACADNESAQITASAATATIVVELYTVTRPTSSNQLTPAFTS